MRLTSIDEDTARILDQLFAGERESDGNEILSDVSEFEAAVLASGSPFSGWEDIGELDREISPTDYIKWVQVSLNRLYGTNHPTDGAISGVYRASLRRFNRDYLGRNYDDVDRKTQDQIIFANEGDESYVHWIINRLNQIGIASLPRTDTYTRAVVNAVKAFQQSKKLVRDGFVGPKTELALILATGVQPPGHQIAPKPVKPRPKPTPWRKPKRSEPLNRAAIKSFAWAILGKSPSRAKWRRNLKAAKTAVSFLKAAYSAVAGSATGPISPGFLWTVVKQFSVKHQEKPYLLRGAAMGMAYALMDQASSRRRSSSALSASRGIPLKMRKGFGAGYSKMRRRLRDIRAENPAAVKELLDRLGAVENKSAAVRNLYDALLQVFWLTEDLDEFPVLNSMLRFCRFRYPAIKACCGPNPGCRLDL